MGGGEPWPPPPPPPGITGKALGDAIMHWLDVNELPVANMRGLCYDGASGSTL